MSKICWPSGLDVSYETVRRWVLKFGPLFAKELRRRCHRPTSHWHLDEMAVLIAGRRFWLWRAVDDEGEVLDLLVQRRRDKTAAVKLMRKLLKKHGFAPDVLVTDQLRSYAAAKSELRLTARHEQGLRRNNRGREFAPAGSSPRAEDAAVQIARISTTVPVRSCRSPERVQRPTPSRFPQHAPRSQRRSVSELAGGNCRLNKSRALRFSFGRSQVHVTTPFGALPQRRGEDQVTTRRPAPQHRVRDADRRAGHLAGLPIRKR